jgi:ribonuclease P protein component
LLHLTEGLSKPLNKYRFPRELRLIKTDEFSSVFNFRKRISAPHFAVHYQFNALAHPRLGMVVSKKVAKLSVSRNYMRRVIRQLFRLHQGQLRNVDLVVRVQKVFCTNDYIAIEQEFIGLMNKFIKLHSL